MLKNGQTYFKNLALSKLKESMFGHFSKLHTKRLTLIRNQRSFMSQFLVNREAFYKEFLRLKTRTESFVNASSFLNTNKK